MWNDNLTVCLFVYNEEKRIEYAIKNLVLFSISVHLSIGQEAISTGYYMQRESQIVVLAHTDVMHTI